jgi:predicted transport protein
MKATEAKLLDFIRKSPQFVIPIYQRTCSWTDKECRQLTLNMKLPDVDDPKGYCEDISEIGHLGYGDVRATLTSIADVPYIMSLVRQSFDRQIGNDA